MDEMIWRSAISAEMTNGWSEIQIANLVGALDEAVEQVFQDHEIYVKDGE